MANPSRKSELVRGNGVEIETYVDGAGPAFVILPSYGRGGGEDFDDITGRLTRAGWKVLRPQPRGIDGSKGSMTGVSMHDLANDVALVVRALGVGPAVVLGHAYGQGVARMLATDQPELVKALCLAPSQASKVPEDIARTPFIAGDPSKPEAERLAALRKAFFAPDHDATPWLKGWYPETLKMQRGAAASVPTSEWWAGGCAPILDLIPALDPFKPKDCWQELSQQFPDRVTMMVIEDAAHALFPEQPGKVAEVVLPWAAQYKED